MIFLILYCRPYKNKLKLFSAILIEFCLILFHLICEIFLNLNQFNMSKIKNWYILGYILIIILGLAIGIDILVKIV